MKYFMWSSGLLKGRGQEKVARGDLRAGAKRGIWWHGHGLARPNRFARPGSRPLYHCPGKCSKQKTYEKVYKKNNTFF